MGKEITDLTEVTSTAAGDFAYVVDVSDTTDSPQGSSRKVQISNLLPDSGATAGIYGDGTHVPVITVNGKGQIISISVAAISGSGSLLAANNLSDLANPATARTNLGAGAPNGLATLDANSKVPITQIPSAVIGALNYQGAWNATTNSPTLTSGSGTKGYYYKVSTAGTTAIDGISQWNVGDLIAFNGMAWDKIDGVASEVISVAGRTGTVVLTTSDIGGIASYARLDTAQQYTAQQNAQSATLTDGASISWNLNSQQAASVTLGGNRTLANPTNMANIGTYVLIVKQDGTGSRTLSYGTAYKWPGGTPPTLSTGANAVDILSFVSDGTNMYGVIQQAFA